MKYLKVYIENSISKEGLLFKLYRRLFLNRCNELINSCNVWILEFAEEGYINREIGLNKDLEPVISMPNSKCYGFLSDTNMTYEDFLFEKYKFQKVKPETFESYWNP
ncbi:hypothetical protein [Mesonia sp. K7]|uniref:hypothetical protein n=1 Tax=Mesonia sp. K7 TaxID=2218606 RepID=UPI000DAAB5E4|nr:hypothetical protein [Mesonia sp. K7]PZD77379.1 hypothetical protein DNG35_08655 [Mesonia sp. K7]